MVTGRLPSLDRDALVRVSRDTLAHYDAAAQSYREHTLDHDVSQNTAALLDAIEGPGPYTILDLGCGPGRDLDAFLALGHEAVGLDGCAEFVAMARDGSGCEVLHQDFLAMDLPAGAFDGVFANASLFHVPKQELPRVLAEIRSALKPRGVLFSSNPRGNGEEGWSGDRYVCFHGARSWLRLVRSAGYSEITHYYRPPGLPRSQQAWLASVWRKL